MKRVLLVAYAFPPQPSAGALRPGYLARYLPAFGWDVTVLTHSTAQPPFAVDFISAEGVEPQLDDRLRAAIGNGNPDAALRKFLRRAKNTLMFPDATAGWIMQAVPRGLAALRSKRFDAILSTALPSSAHVIGWYLAKRSELPWIADYRDAWSGNPYFHWGPVQSVLEHAAERHCLSRAAALTTVNAAIAEHLRSFHKRGDVFAIPNAFDADEWDVIPDVQPQGFDLCFTGSLYDGKRDPGTLFAAIRDLRAAEHPAGVHARVHFYSKNSEIISHCAERYGVTSAVFQHGVVPRIDALRAQRSAAVLLLLLNNDPATASEMGSKYLEYAGACRPILAFGPAQSVMRTYIEENQAGWFASNVEEMKRALISAYSRFQSGNVTVYPPKSLLTPRGLAQCFAQRLDAAVGETLAPQDALAG